MSKRWPVLMRKKPRGDRKVEMTLALRALDIRHARLLTVNTGPLNGSSPWDRTGDAARPEDEKRRHASDRHPVAERDDIGSKGPDLIGSALMPIRAS